MVESNPFYDWVVWRVEKNKNLIMVINGETGSGKTYAALRMALDVSRLFNSHFTLKDNMDFNHKDLLKKTKLPENDKPGTCFVFEEVGAVGGGASNREWQSKSNQMFDSFIQTSRHRNHVLIMTCPSLSFLDSRARKLVHIQGIMQGINFQNKKSVMKLYRLQHHMRKDKTYFKLLRYKVYGQTYKLSSLGFELIPEDITKEYERIKTKYTDALYDKIINEGENKKVRAGEPQVMRKEMNLDKVVHYLNKGLGPTEIARLLNVSHQTVWRYKKTIINNNRVTKKGSITGENGVLGGNKALELPL